MSENQETIVRADNHILARAIIEESVRVISRSPRHIVCRFCGADDPQHNSGCVVLTALRYVGLDGGLK